MRPFIDHTNGIQPIRIDDYKPSSTFRMTAMVVLMTINLTLAAVTTGRQDMLIRSGRRAQRRYEYCQQDDKRK